jgi:hypothetical protein
VSADLFGRALRAYVRKMGRLQEGETQRGVTLWQAVLDHVRTEEMVQQRRSGR